MALTLALLVGISALVWFGYRATREWRRSTEQLVFQRANEVLALLMAGLSRDMKGAQLSVLVPINHEALRSDPPHELRQVFARAFARFPYPESFFVWRATSPGSELGLTYVFNRADRPPRWSRAPIAGDPYPVVLSRDPDGIVPLVNMVRTHAGSGRTFALVDTNIEGTPYQAVAHLLYQSDAPTQLFGLVGFTVDMDWVRAHYFEPIVRQVARIGGDADEMLLEIVNERGVVVAANTVASRAGAVAERTFPFMFFDPDLLAAMPPPRPQVSQWKARVAPGSEGAVDSAVESADRTFLLISLAAIATVIGLAVTARAVRAAAVLAAMQSDFVSTVTHELKTPLASIRLISDTLAQGRYSTPDTIGDYARLLSDESDRLRALVDNLLTFARVTDTRRKYNFETIDILDIVEDVLEHAHGRLAEQHFEVVVSIPTNLPRVYGDRVAVMQVLANLIDNTIKYSECRSYLAISARRHGDDVTIEVADHGIGICREELERVFERFYRGHGVRPGGSGLGLTIARRVVEDHGGRVTLRSEKGEGTVVTITLPAGNHV